MFPTGLFLFVYPTAAYRSRKYPHRFPLLFCTIGFGFLHSCVPDGRWKEYTTDPLFSVFESNVDRQVVRNPSPKVCPKKRCISQRFFMQSRCLPIFVLVGGRYSYIAVYVHFKSSFAVYAKMCRYSTERKYTATCR